MEKEKEKVKSPSPPPVKQKVVEQKDVSESEKIAFNNAVEEIGTGSFIQETFKSSRGSKPENPEANAINGEEFNFGTQAEVSAKGGKFIPMSDDSLFSPQLFGDYEEREEKFLRRIFSLRQKALLGEPL